MNTGLFGTISLEVIGIGSRCLFRSFLRLWDELLLLRITSSSDDGDRSIAAVGAAFTIDSDGGHYSHFGVTSGDFFLSLK